MEEEIKFLIGFSLLLYASYKDWKEREISNWVWVFMAIAGILFLSFDIIYANVDLMKVLISITISFVLAFALLLFGMGGADSKALLTLAVLFPLPPSFSIIHSPIFVFPLTILVNSLLFIIPLPLVFLLYNVVKKEFEFPYALFGYKMSSSMAEKKHVWSMEDENSKSIMPKKEVDFSIFNGRKIWVTPQLPFIIFITAGYFVACVFGDILTFVITLFQ